MAMDIRIFGNCRVEMGALFRRQLLAIFNIFIILTTAVGSPVWMPQFLSGGQGRSIRHLPCVSRRTGEQGICMFAYTCLKSNGTHLGTCIDRFYFGSCCKLGETDDLLVDSHFPVINNNQVTMPYFPSTNFPKPVSVQNEMNKITETLFPTSTKLSYPTRITQKIETTTKPTKFGTPVTDMTDKTIVDLAQHLATETYFLTPSTEKYFVPVHTSKPNRTDVFTTMVSSSGVYGRPTVVGQNTYGVTETPAGTTPPYLLSTFQVVHNQGGQTTQTPVKATSAPPATTKRPVSKPATVVSTWSSKPDLTTPTTVKRNTTDSASKPTQHTTTKKPVKPVKPLTTTRKPPTKKPVTTATKPTVVKITTQKPTTPTKKPTQPTKKPTVTKPPSTKPTSTRPTNGTRPAVSTATTPKPTTTTSRIITKKPTTVTASTSNRYPVFSTYVDTTSEVVFTKPGFTTAPSQTPGYGITTFRPDLGGPTSKPVSVPSSGLTTFSYVSEGVKVTTVRPPETTTFRYRPTKPAYSPTISNEITSSHWSGGSPVGGASEAQEENTNIIFQQVGSTLRPGSPTTVTSSKPVDTSVPFFPDAERPGIPTQWIEMIQTSMKPESPYSPPATTTTASTAAQSTTTMAIFEGLNQTDYTQVCGRRIYPQARVVGGEKSTFGKWPWQISLRQWRTSTYLHKCGAALLNENWAITAAHCVENVPPSDLLLRLGEHDLSTEDEPFGFQERRVQIVASHPQFDPRTFEYDLALLRFYEPVKFQPNIIPVCVPEDNTNFVGQTAYVTGWGRLYEDGPLPSVLQEVSVPVINNTLCENMYRSAGYIEHIPEIFICAGWKKGGFDSCEGDSGGPMVIQRPDKRWLLAGVISWGIGCAEPNQPGVYTRISEFREWIHQILQF